MSDDDSSIRILIPHSKIGDGTSKGQRVDKSSI